jgi:hypothetical protein
MTKSTNFTRKLRNLTLAVAMAATSVGALAAPALAADWHHGPARHEYRDHRWHDRFYGPVVAVDPGYGYAPYGYAPPPAPVYAAPPVLSLILPIHIR